MAKKYEYITTQYREPKKQVRAKHDPYMTHSVGDHIYYANIAPKKPIEWSFGTLYFKHGAPAGDLVIRPREERLAIERGAIKSGVNFYGIKRKSQPRAYHVKGIPEYVSLRQYVAPYDYATNIQERIKLSKKEPRVIISPEELKYNPVEAIEYNLAKIARHKRVTRGKKSFRS